MSDKNDALFESAGLSLSREERDAVNRFAGFPDDLASQRLLLYETKILDAALRGVTNGLTAAADASAKYAEVSASHTKSLTHATWVLAGATVILALATIGLLCASYACR